MAGKRKRYAACILAALMVSGAVNGCQSPVNSLNKETVKDLAAEGQNFLADGGIKTSVPGADVPGEKEEGWMDNQSFVKGAALEAEEPKKANISPEDYEGWSRLLEANGTSEEFARGLDRFAYKSGSAVLKGTKGNENYSPLSLYYTLALAGCGAKGETAGQILENLGIKDQKELADQCRKLYQWYAYQNQKEKEQMEYYGIESGKSAIRLGNSLWISNQLPVGAEYQKLAAENFFASSYSVDFEDPDTGKQIGEWIAEKTNGTLAPQITMDPGTVLAVLNTLYFYGGWANPFSEEMTREDIFNLEGGGTVTVPYLNRTEMMGTFRKGDGYTLSYLDTDNHCKMVFLLPDEGRTPEEFLESPDILRSAMEAEEEDWISGKVIWKVPKFDFGSSYTLNDVLKAMGMERMFDSQAEFGGISSDPLLVSSVIQETHIGLDENGVEGAAYTMMAMARGALIEQQETAEMILDRPFLYGIRDDVHGAWLFLGVLRNPGEEGADGVSADGGRNALSEEFPEGFPDESLLKKAELDIFLTSAPEIWLSDALSSTNDRYVVKPGNYTWNWEENGEMAAVTACGSHPLDTALKKEDILKIPDYKSHEEAAYILRCAIMPEKLTLREWDVSQIGKAEAEKPLETVYEKEGILLLKHDKVYEIEAEWPEEMSEGRGFFGKASYVVVTD